MAFEDFDIKSELSILVEKKIIPSRIAEKLEQKLTEKQIKLNKEQLHKLVNKILEIINNNVKLTNGKETIDASKIGIKNDKDMLYLVETVEKIQERITNLEEGTPPQLVKTDDIHVSEKITLPNESWEMQPLTNVPNDAENIIVLMKWLQYLVDKCGHSHLSDVLDYYVDIGWITEDVKISLLDYSQGITEIKRGDATSSRGVSNLPSKDHIQSLLYIQKLKGVKLDKHLLDRIEADLSRINKKLDQYQFKI